MSLQRKDGSFKNKGNLWSDKNITTAFALYSLMHFANSYNPEVRKSLLKGLEFLVQEIRVNEKNKELEWEPNNYFTATAIAR